MRVDGKHLFNASLADVWGVLADVPTLARCTPGCEALREVGPGQYELDLHLGVGAIKGQYSGKFAIRRQEPPNRSELEVSAKGIPGWMQGRWTMELTPRESGTELTYQGEAQVGGLVAGVGQRMLGGVAKMILGQLFTAMAREVDARRESVGAQTLRAMKEGAVGAAVAKER